MSSTYLREKTKTQKLREQTLFLEQQLEQVRKAFSVGTTVSASNTEKRPQKPAVPRAQQQDPTQNSPGRKFIAPTRSRSSTTDTANTLHSFQSSVPSLVSPRLEHANSISLAKPPLVMVAENSRRAASASKKRGEMAVPSSTIVNSSVNSSFSETQYYNQLPACLPSIKSPSAKTTWGRQEATISVAKHRRLPKETGGSSAYFDNLVDNDHDEYSGNDKVNAAVQNTSDNAIGHEEAFIDIFAREAADFSSDPKAFSKLLTSSSSAINKDGSIEASQQEKRLKLENHPLLAYDPRYDDKKNGCLDENGERLIRPITSSSKVGTADTGISTAFSPEIEQNIKNSEDILMKLMEETKKASSETPIERQKRLISQVINEDRPRDFKEKIEIDGEIYEISPEEIEVKEEDILIEYNKLTGKK